MFICFANHHLIMLYDWFFFSKLWHSPRVIFGQKKTARLSDNTIHSNPNIKPETLGAFYFPYTLFALFLIFPNFVSSFFSICKELHGRKQTAADLNSHLLYEPYVCYRKKGVSVLVIYGEHEWLKHTHALQSFFLFVFLNFHKNNKARRQCEGSRYSFALQLLPRCSVTSIHQRKKRMVT